MKLNPERKFKWKLIKDGDAVKIYYEKGNKYWNVSGGVYRSNQNIILYPYQKDA